MVFSFGHHFFLAFYSVYVYSITMSIKNTYPDWVEKYRGKGLTIRKVRDGYGLSFFTLLNDSSKTKDLSMCMKNNLILALIS